MLADGHVSHIEQPAGLEVARGKLERFFEVSNGAHAARFILMNTFSDDRKQAAFSIDAVNAIDGFRVTEIRDPKKIVNLLLDVDLNGVTQTIDQVGGRLHLHESFLSPACPQQLLAIEAMHDTFVPSRGTRSAGLQCELSHLERPYTEERVIKLRLLIDGLEGDQHAFMTLLKLV